MDSNSDTDSSVGDDFLSTVGSIRSDIQTQADDIRKDFENIKTEQKAIEEKRLAEFEEMKKAEEEKAEEMKFTLGPLTFHMTIKNSFRYIIY